MSVLTITDENFDMEVAKSAKPVLLDFWSERCGPCRLFMPIVEEIASEHTDKKVGRVNVDEQPELAEKFGIMSIPTLVFIKDGKIVKKSVGAKPKRFINDMLS